MSDVDFRPIDPVSLLLRAAWWRGWYEQAALHEHMRSPWSALALRYSLASEQWRRVGGWCRSPAVSAPQDPT